MDRSRPAVPADVKRQLRQEAGFGCCNCGHPFIQYHHIIPWAVDQHFRPEDMMVLCGQCHPLCTVGALSESQQRQLKAKPKNVVDGLARGQLYVNQKELIVKLGNATITETPNLLVLSGQTVLNARANSEDGRVLVSALIHDLEGQVIGAINDNEWEILVSETWDFEAFPLHAAIRTAQKQISFAIDVRQDHVEMRGQWYHRGLPLLFTPAEVRLGTNRFNFFNVSHCRNAFAVD